MQMNTSNKRHQLSVREIVKESIYFFHFSILFLLFFLHVCNLLLLNF